MKEIKLKPDTRLLVLTGKGSTGVKKGRVPFRGRQLTLFVAIALLLAVPVLLSFDGRLQRDVRAGVTPNRHTVLSTAPLNLVSNALDT